MLTVQLIVIIIPLALLLAVALQRQANLGRFIFSSLAMLLGVAFVWIAMPWDVVSMYYRMLIPLLAIIAVWSGYSRIGTAGKIMPRWQVILNYNIYGALIILFGLFCLGAIVGYQPPPGAIALSAPLKDGRFVVGQGGSSPVINGHATVSPQNHALDIMALDKWGTRSNLWGDRSNNAAYEIFGKPIIAPCDGEVLIAVDGLEDLPPPERDARNLAGNHVALGCFGAEIVLAHMQKDSVQVKVGQVVKTGDLLGRVGNSGNTSEPHLHIHAEKEGEPGKILDGSAVPFTIDGRYLVRGSTF